MGEGVPTGMQQSSVDATAVEKQDVYHMNIPWFSSEIAGGGQNTRIGKMMKVMSTWRTVCCMIGITCQGLHQHQIVFWKRDRASNNSQGIIRNDGNFSSQDKACITC